MADYFYFLKSALQQQQQQPESRWKRGFCHGWWWPLCCCCYVLLPWWILQNTRASLVYTLCCSDVVVVVVVYILQTFPPPPLLLCWRETGESINRTENTIGHAGYLPPLSLRRWHINLVVSRNIQQQPAIWPSQFSAHLPLPSTWLMLKNTLGALLNAVQLNCTQLRAFDFFKFRGDFDRTVNI